MRSPAARRLLFHAFALLSALLVAAFGVLVSAAGHGWTVAPFAATALLTIPAAAAAWSLRTTRAGRGLADVVSVANVAVDAGLVWFTLRDGMADFESLAGHLAVPVTLWAALWLGWQALALAAAFPRERG